MEKKEKYLKDAHEKKTTQKKFCTKNICSVVFMCLLLAAVAVVCVITFLVKSVRDEQRYDPSHLEWWKKAIIYQVYPRSFMDSDGDGLGDLKGIQQKLDYFNDIGVDAIWISPFFQSPMVDYGYDVSNYTAVDPLFGTIQDFDELAKDAREKGIYIILDFVPNHTSNESEWFIRSRERDPHYENYYVWRDCMENGKVVDPTNWRSVFGGSPWTYDEVRGQCYYHAFLKEQPDLNYRNPNVTQDVLDAMEFWLKKKVGGFRMDAVKFMYEDKNFADEYVNTPGDDLFHEERNHNATTNSPLIYDMVRKWRALINKYDRQGFLISESYYITEEMRNDYYSAGSVPFNFALLTALKDCDHLAICVKQAIEEGLKDLPANAWPNFVMGNHDNARIRDRVGDHHYEAMLMLLLTLPGTPTSYYGDEIGMKNVFYTFNESRDPAGTKYGPQKYTQFSRDPERSPMLWDSSSNAGFSSGTPWLHVDPGYKQLNVEVQKTQKQSTLSLFKKLAKTRKNPSFQSTDFNFVTTNDNVLSYVRHAQGWPKFLMVFNFGNSTVKADFTKNLGDVESGTVDVVTNTAGDTALKSEAEVSLKGLKLLPGQAAVIRLKLD